MIAFLEKLKSMSRRRRSRRFVAVDFDSHALRLVQAEQVGSIPRILMMREFPFPQDLNVSDAEAVGGALGTALKEAGLSGSPVLLSVPRGQAVLKSLTLPAGVRKMDMPGMVHYQVQGDLPFRAEEAVIDFTVEEHYNADAARQNAAVAGGPATGVHLLAAAVRMPMVDHYRRIAEAAGARLERLGLRPYANLRCVAACTVRRPEELVAVVHVTADQTEIDVIAGDSLSFSRSAVLRVPAAGKDNAREVDESIQSVVMEVVRTLQSYQAVQREEDIGAILVAGGTGIEARVTEVLGKRMGVQSEVLAPSGLVRARGGGNPSAFITALGLAFGHCREDELRMDFLNPKRPVVQRDIRKVRAAVALAASALVALGGIATGAMYVRSKDKVRTQLLEQKKKLSADAGKIQELVKRIKGIDAWASEGRDWLDHLAYLSWLLPGAKDGYVTGLTTTSSGSINIPFKAFNDSVLEDFYKRVTDAGYDLKLGDYDPGEDKYGFRYGMKMNLGINPKMTVNLASVKPVQRPSDDVSADPAKRKGEGPSSPPRTETPPAVPSGTGAAGQPATPTVSGGTGGPTATPLAPGQINPAVFLDPTTMAQHDREKWEAVTRWDTDGDGKVSPAEEKAKYDYRRKLARMFNDRQKELTARFDQNGNGKVENDEWRVMESRLWQEELRNRGVGQ
jgi:Tfp pilus assembly PilM family ATPase